jgi:hypothetical protein
MYVRLYGTIKEVLSFYLQELLAKLENKIESMKN